MATKCEHCPLRQLEIFKAFTVEEMKFMQRFKVGELTVEPGTTIIAEGSNAPQMYTVLDGLGLRLKAAPENRRQVVNFVFPGDFIGMQSSIMGEMGHSVEATTDMTLCVFERSEVWNLFRNHPDRAFDLTWLAASEEMFLGEALTSIGQRTALESVAWALMRLFQRGENLGLANINAMPLPFRQQDLADSLGLSLVHTNKTLAKLKDRRLVTWTDGVLTVLDAEALADVAGTALESPKSRPLI